MTAAAAAAAAVTATLLHIPSYYYHYYPPPLTQYRTFFLYHGCTFGFPPPRRPCFLPQKIQDNQTDNETFDGNLKSEGDDPWLEKPSEVKHLKLILHEKELELSQLKEQIQKEKIFSWRNALELTQIKAENEIRKAQERIWEKDAELQAAEDCLAGLKEVQIENQGEGDIVEVAGSFHVNGSTAF